MILQDAHAARIAECPQFAEQHRRRNPCRRGGPDPFSYVLLVMIELAWPRLTLVVRQSVTAYIAPHRVARYLEHPSDLANALALSAQGPNLHRFLRHQHEALRCGVPHAGVGQFSIGDPGQFCTGGYSVAGQVNFTHTETFVWAGALSEAFGVAVPRQDKLDRMGRLRERGF